MARWIAGGIFLLAVVSLSLETYAAGPYETFSVSRVEAKAAPDFSLPSVNGKSVRLSDYQGKVVLLGFFQTF